MALDRWVYGDESGNSSTRHTIVSAYVGSRRAWDALRKEWEPVIKDAGVPELHAKALFSRKLAAKDGSSKNPFALWSNEEVIVFIERLARIVRRHRRSILPVATVIHVGGFSALPRADRNLLTGGQFLFWHGQQRGRWHIDGKPSEPYMLAFQSVVKKALALCPTVVKMHMVFDMNENVEPAAERLIAAVKEWKAWDEYAQLGGLTFEDSKDFPGIQMADFRGFLLNRHASQGSDPMEPEQAWALSRLNHRIEYDYVDSNLLDETLSLNLTAEQREWLQRQS